MIWYFTLQKLKENVFGFIRNKHSWKCDDSCLKSPVYFFCYHSIIKMTELFALCWVFWWAQVFAVSIICPENEFWTFVESQACISHHKSQCRTVGADFSDFAVWRHGASLVWRAAFVVIVVVIPGLVERSTPGDVTVDSADHATLHPRSQQQTGNERYCASQPSVELRSRHYFPIRDLFP